jgi:hypothetical protein
VHVVQAWVDFLQSFGLQEQQMADLLRSSPELFYTSNIFQVRLLARAMKMNGGGAIVSNCRYGAVHCLIQQAY